MPSQYVPDNRYTVLSQELTLNVWFWTKISNPDNFNYKTVIKMWFVDDWWPYILHIMLSLSLVYLLHIKISDISCTLFHSIPPERVGLTKLLLYRSPLLSRQESRRFQQEKEVECSSRRGEVENVDWSVEINPKVEGIMHLLKVQHWRRRRNVIYHTALPKV